MPRLARLDAPGVLHHVIIRGIERRDIFQTTRNVGMRDAGRIVSFLTCSNAELR